MHIMQIGKAGTRAKPIERWHTSTIAAFELWNGCTTSKEKRYKKWCHSFNERRSFEWRLERRSRSGKWVLSWAPLIISPVSASWALLTFLLARKLESGAQPFWARVERRSHSVKWALSWASPIISQVSASWAPITFLSALALVSGDQLSAALSAAQIFWAQVEGRSRSGNWALSWTPLTFWNWALSWAPLTFWWAH